MMWLILAVSGGIDDDEDFLAGQFLRPSLEINADASLSFVKD